VSEADVELAKSIFERLAGGGVEAVADSFDKDFEFTTPAALASEPDTYRGVEGVRRWFDSFYEAMDRVELVPRDIVDAGEGRVAVAFTIETRGRTTGLELTQEAAMLVRIRDERAHRFEIFPTLDEALELAEAEESA
jgi:ketosteroid isomerase-like protein